MSIGLIGRKVGMTQVFAEDGTMVPVSVVAVEPNTVTELRTVERDGYTAVQVGAGTSKKLTKPRLGQLKDLTALATLPLAVVLVGGEGPVRRIVAWVTGLMWLLCLYGIAQFFFTDLGELHNRIPGPFSHYMTVSGVLLVGLCLVLARLSSRTPRSGPGSTPRAVTTPWCGRGGPSAACRP